MQKIHNEQNAKFTVKTGSTLLISPFISGCCLTWPGVPDFKLLCDLEHPFSLAGPQFPRPAQKELSPGASSVSDTLVLGFEPLLAPGRFPVWAWPGRGACRSAAAKLGKACPSQTTFTQSFCSIWVEFHKCLPKNTQEARRTQANCRHDVGTFLAVRGGDDSRGALLAFRGGGNGDDSPS